MSEPPRWHVAGPVENDRFEGLVQRCLRCDEVVVRVEPIEGDPELEQAVGAGVRGHCLGDSERRELVVALYGGPEPEAEPATAD